MRARTQTHTHTENRQHRQHAAHTAAEDVLDRHFEAVAEVDGRVDGVDGQLQACKRIDQGTRYQGRALGDSSALF